MQTELKDSGLLKQAYRHIAYMLKIKTTRKRYEALNKTVEDIEPLLD